MPLLRTGHFTIIQHEPVFLPIWLEYYSRHFEAGDLHVIHHLLPTPRDARESEVKQTWEADFGAYQARYGFVVHPIVNEASFDHEWLKQVVCRFQRQLLNEYDAVLFTEADEIVATDPRSRYGTDLGAYIQENLRDKEFRVCSGYEVVHRLDAEVPLDLNSRPLLSQRKWWYWNKMYSKPLLSRIPMDWCWGFHASRQSPVPYRFRDEDLLLIHLHKVDFDICRERNATNASRRWADGSFGFQNRITGEEKLRRWWYNDIDMHSQEAVLTVMPIEVGSVV